MLGFNVPYANSSYFAPGMLFYGPTGCALATNCNVYEVVNANVTTPVGHICSEFWVGAKGAETGANGYNPYNVSPLSSVKFSCTILDSSDVLLEQTDGGQWATDGSTYTQFEGGPLCNFFQSYAAPNDEICLAELITSKRTSGGGLAGLTYPEWPGMPANPTLSPNDLNVTAHP